MEVLTSILTGAITVASVVLAVIFAVLYLRRGLSTSGGGVEDANRANSMLFKQYEQVLLELAEVKREVSIYVQLTIMLSSQLAENGVQPKTRHDAEIALGLAQGPHVARASSQARRMNDIYGGLRDVLANRFTDEELLAVAVDAGFTRDAVSGESQMARAIRLVEYAVQRNAVAALERAIEKYRPGAILGQMET